MEYDEKASCYRNVVNDAGEVVKGKKVLYTSLNGNMYSFLGIDGALAFRFPGDEISGLLESLNTEQPISYGTVMKDYVTIPNEVIATNHLRELFLTCLDHARQLKPKPTKKRA